MFAKGKIISSSEPAKRERVIQWDEETIAEHDKERGTRQKIDEPSTPFRHSDGGSAYDSDSEQEATQKNDVMQSWEKLNAQLCYHQHLQQTSDLQLAQENGGKTAVIAQSKLQPHQCFNEFGELPSADSEEILSENPSSHECAQAHMNVSSSECEEGGGGEEGEFKQKRAAHYNEYLVLKALRSKRDFDDDENEGDIT